MMEVLARAAVGWGKDMLRCSFRKCTCRGIIVPQGPCHVHNDESGRVDHVVNILEGLKVVCDAVSATAQVSSAWGKNSALVIGITAALLLLWSVLQQIIDRIAEIGWFIVSH